MSKENLLLSFKPARFFYELSQISPYPEKTIKTAYYRAKQHGLVEISDVTPRLTPKGRRLAAPFQTTKVSRRGKLLVIFDIPENQAYKRNEFRRLLQRLGFSQAQLSVWMSEYDHRQVVLEAIEELELGAYVKFFEAAQLSS